MKKTFFNLFTIILLLGLTSLGSSEMRISLNNVNVDLPKIEVDIHLADGKGVAGYILLLAYDPAVLKYVDTTQGDYLPADGIFLRPALSADDTYELQLSIGETTTTGQSVVLGVGEEARTLSLSNYFFERPSDDFFNEPPGLKFQALSVLSQAPLASDGTLTSSDGHGTLASVSFDVLNPDAPMVIYLVSGGPFGADDKVLYATLVNNVATFRKLASDVNADGVVNILDLTGAAAAFGTSVTDANHSSDVNADGEINILDLVHIANDFGEEILSFDTQSIGPFHEPF